VVFSSLEKKALRRIDPVMKYKMGLISKETLLRLIRERRILIRKPVPDDMDDEELLERLYRNGKYAGRRGLRPK